MLLKVLFVVFIAAFIGVLLLEWRERRQGNATTRREATPEDSTEHPQRSSRPSAPTLLRYQGIEWERGHTSMSGMPREEFQRRLGALSRASARERLAVSQRNLKEYRRSSARLRDTRGDNTVDYRELGFTSPVTDQGRCGSCVAHGCTNAANATVKKGEKNVSLDIRLSPADLFFCKAAKQGFGCDTGWYVDSGLCAMRQGIVSEADYPYNVADQHCPVDTKPLVAVGGIHTIEKKSIEKAKRWLNEHGAIATSMVVMASFRDYKGGLYVPLEEHEDFLGFHCIDIEGYSDSASAWLCKNSWGTEWGEEGYFWIPFGRCGIDSEMFGIGSYFLNRKQLRHIHYSDRQQPSSRLNKPSCPGCRARTY